jgi:hypothetical protein
MQRKSASSHHSSQKIKRSSMASLNTPQNPLAIKFPVLGLGMSKPYRSIEKGQNPFARKLKLYFNSYV